MTAPDQTDGAKPRPDRSRTLLWVFGGVVLLTLVIGVVVGALRNPATLDPQSPEGVVQSYLVAVLDDDFVTAASYLSAETAQRCRASAFREAWVPDDLTADLDDVRFRADRAEVRVQLRSATDPLSLESPDSPIETFVLIEDDGPWRIAGDPWPLYSCEPPP
jgi:hypothetical protein